MIVERLLPEDVTTELAHLMDKKYAGYRRDRNFSIAARRDYDRVSVAVVLRNSNEHFYYPVEGRLNFVDETMKPEEAAFFLIDYIDLYFNEFFTEEENVWIPIDWAKFEYEATDFELKGQVYNKYAEGLADKLLADANLLNDETMVSRGYSS